MILKKDGLGSAAAKPEPGIPLRNIQKNNSESRKMALKVCLQKSTNKFLFVEAMDDFVDFLFSFLVVPLGGVEFLLGGTPVSQILTIYTEAYQMASTRSILGMKTLKLGLSIQISRSALYRRTSFYRWVKIVLLNCVRKCSGMVHGT